LFLATRHRLLFWRVPISSSVEGVTVSMLMGTTFNYLNAFARNNPRTRFISTTFIWSYYKHTVLNNHET